MELRLIYSTHPSAEQARATAMALIGEKLAACCNIIPGMESYYLWEGAITNASEVAMISKTTQLQSDAVIARIRALHPYETPAIASLAIAGGYRPFLDWIAESCSPPKA